jgi:SUMO ligase MMS21 Smc5/6 complex component
MKLPILKPELAADTKQYFCIQKIIKYDDHTESVYTDYMKVYDSETGEIDEAILKERNQHAEFCKYNKYVKPHTLILRKIAIKCEMAAISEIKEHYGNNDYHQLQCAACKGMINYGDDVLADQETGNVYCCAECYFEDHNVINYDSPSDEYDAMFKNK